MVLALTSSLQPLTDSEIIAGFKDQDQVDFFKINLVKIQTNLNLDTVSNGKCMFQYRDPKIVTKMLCAIIAQFNASLNVSTTKMDAGDIYECATMLSEYTHDRFEDIILCLKMAKYGEFGKIYNRVDTLVIMDFWKQYLDRKAIHREHQYKTSKNGEYRTEADTQLISNSRQFESALDKANRLATAQRKEIVTLKSQIANL